MICSSNQLINQLTLLQRYLRDFFFLCSHQWLLCWWWLVVRWGRRNRERLLATSIRTSVILFPGLSFWSRGRMCKKITNGKCRVTSYSRGNQLFFVSLNDSIALPSHSNFILESPPIKKEGLKKNSTFN